jgi:hypothetical protein
MGILGKTKKQEPRQVDACSHLREYGGARGVLCPGANNMQCSPIREGPDDLSYAGDELVGVPEPFDSD